MLEAHGIHKTYKNGAKELEVLKGIDLKIAAGEFAAVFGPSGAGKTTLLHILGGLDEPTKGTALLQGKDLYKLSDRRRAEVRNKKIGFVFQFYHLLPEFTALENVMLPALIGHRSGGARRPATGDWRLATEKASGLLSLVGLKDRVGHKPSQLSGGEQQRVAIARALVNEPDILLCDEPTGNLDSESGKGIMELLYKLNRDNRTTMVIVTHEEEIAEKSGRIFRIKDGRLERG